MIARAYSPGHISSVFRVSMHAEPFLSGSRGAGIVIDEGVVTEVERVASHGVDVYLNGQRTRFVPTARIAEKMMPGGSGGVVVRHETKLPVGAGFGVSAACVLGAGLCINELFSLGMDELRVGQVAHVTEVECGTGLGDVTPMLAGGVELRRKEGAPGYGVVECIDCGIEDIVCFSFGPLETKKVTYGADFSGINSAADDVLPLIFSLHAVDNFMKCSLDFAKRAGFLTPRLERAISAINAMPGCCASQTMLGESGFAVVGGDMVKNVIDELVDVDCVFHTKVGYEPARLI